LEITDLMNECLRLKYDNKLIEEELKYFKTTLERRKPTVEVAYKMFFSHQLVHELASSLKKKIIKSLTSKQAWQTLKSVNKSAFILSHPKFSESFNEEQKILINKIEQILEEIIHNYKKRGETNNKQIYMSKHMNSIYKCKKALSKANTLEHICEKLFFNIKNDKDIQMQPIIDKINNFTNELKHEQENSVQDWQDDCQVCIDDIENQIDSNLIHLD